MTTATEEIIAKAEGGTSFPPHPDGQYAARCIDIVDLGMVEMTWQGVTRKKHRIIVRFFCGEYSENDKGERVPLWVDRRFTLTLHENGDLRPFLENWRGRKFTDEELQGFNVVKLLHAEGLVQVSHNTRTDRTYANVDSIMRLPKGLSAPDVPADYVRVKDRPKDEPAQSQSNGSAPPNHGRPWDDEDDQDLPF